jgi:hypothetical protein
MTPDTELTVAVFRKWRAYPHEVIALFPEIEARSGFCESYEHVGQHGGAQYEIVNRLTVPATPDEYASLKSELESIGYRLDVKLRRPHKRNN